MSTAMPSDYRLNQLIDELDAIGRKHDVHEYGLPTHDDGRMAQMREKVRELLQQPADENLRLRTALELTHAIAGEGSVVRRIAEAALSKQPPDEHSANRRQR